MKKIAIYLAITSSLLATNLLLAETGIPVEHRLKTMEKRLQYLEQRIQSQDKVIHEKNEQLSKLSKDDEGSSSASGWFDKVEIGGLVEVEAQHISPDIGDNSSDIYVATAEIGIAAQVNDWTNAEIVLLYEDEGNHSGDIAVDVAAITIADPNSIWFTTTGIYTLPFGSYGTNVISDPITLDLGETRDAAIEVGISTGNFSGSLYVFKGDQQNSIKNYGASLGYTAEFSGAALTAGLGYVNDLAESDGIVDDATVMTNKAPAWTANAELAMGPFTLIGEYLTATKSIQAYANDKPSAYNIEAAYAFTAMGKGSSVAIAFQGTDDAANTAGGMDEKRIVGAYVMEIAEATTLGIEYMKSEDYAGDKTDTITAQLAVEF